MLYMCGSCKKGEHEKCERGFPASPPGSFGGRKCVCPCMGRTKEQWDKDIKRELREKVRKVFDGWNNTSNEKEKPLREEESDGLV